MNCNEAKLKMLLQSSGELAATEQAELDTHINSCVECTKYREANDQIMELAIQAMPDNGPSAEVLDHISTQAVKVPHRTLIFRRHMIQWTAAAAALLLIVLGNWSSTTNIKAAENGISDMYAILAIATYANDDTADDEIPDIEELLLQMEDSFDDYDLTEEEFWEPQSKSPQAYNIRAPQQKIYG